MTKEALDALSSALTALTPAPWSRDPDTDPENADAVITDGLHPFLCVQCGEGAAEEAEAIVALRNAAPELIAGCREALRLMERVAELENAFRSTLTDMDIAVGGECRNYDTVSNGRCGHCNLCVADDALEELKEAFRGKTDAKETGE